LLIIVIVLEGLPISKFDAIGDANSDLGLSVLVEIIDGNAIPVSNANSRGPWLYIVLILAVGSEIHHLQ
jgi:hypothetical protein